MILDQAANAVLQEFGGLIDERLCSFEDTKREFLYTRQLELQKLGIADSNKTVVLAAITPPTSREETVVVPTDKAGIIPAFVEFLPSTSTRRRETVRIVPVEDIPKYEGSYAIAFHGEPMKYRLAWNAWGYGTLYFGYDGIEDMSVLSGASDLAFPPAFWTYLVKKTAFNLIDMIRLKMSFLMRPEEMEQIKLIASALDSKEKKLIVQCQEWQNEFHRHINKDLNQQPILRRSNEELWARQNDQNRPPSFLFES